MTMMLFFAIVLSFLSLTLAESNSTSLEKRGGQIYHGDGTFFGPDLGACGIWNTKSDHIVALNHPQYGGGFPGKNCFRRITIMHNGKTAEAEITDLCPECLYGSLDMSPSLFDIFEPPSVGRFQMSWYYNDDPPSKPTSTHHTTTTKKTTTTKHSTTTHTLTTSTKAAATPTVTPGPGNNIALLNIALLSMVEMAVAGASL